MNWDLAYCEDSELLKISDRLSRCLESKIQLELELSNEEFKLKYIHQRRELTAGKIRTRMMYIILFTIVELVCLVTFIMSFIYIKEIGYEAGPAISMMLVALVFIFCGFVCIKLWIPEIRMFKKFNPFSKNRNEDDGAVTFEIEKQKAEEAIALLKAQIITMNKEISKLASQKRERESFVRDKMLQASAANTADENDAAEACDSEATGLFKLRKDKLTTIQATEMIQNFNKDIKSLEKKKALLELEDKKLQDKIIDIDVQILLVRERVSVFMLVITVLTSMVSLFSGTVIIIMAVIWAFVVVSYSAWIVSVCKEPVILYLVEHEHKQIRDYAFTHSLTPLYKVRRELARDIVDCSNEINRLQGEKQNIEALKLG